MDSSWQRLTSAGYAAVLFDARGWSRTMGQGSFATATTAAFAAAFAEVVDRTAPVGSMRIGLRALSREHRSS